MELREKEYLAVMIENDFPNHAEFPHGFNYKAAEKRFRNTVSEIEGTLGQALVTQTLGEIQDASFHGELFLPSEFLAEGCSACIRFSNFGNFVSVYTDYTGDSEIKPEVKNRTVSILEKNGYMFLPGTSLRL